MIGWEMANACSRKEPSPSPPRRLDARDQSSVGSGRKGPDGRIPGLPLEESKTAAGDDRAVEENHQETARNSLAAKSVPFCGLEAPKGAKVAQEQAGDNGSAGAITL